MFFGDLSHSRDIRFLHQGVRRCFDIDSGRIVLDGGRDIDRVIDISEGVESFSLHILEITEAAAVKIPGCDEMAVDRENAEGELDGAHTGACGEPLDAVFKHSHAFLKDIPCRIGCAGVVIAGRLAQAGMSISCGQINRCTDGTGFWVFSVAQLRKITLNADLIHHRFPFMRNDTHECIVIYLSFKINISAMVA